MTGIKKNNKSVSSITYLGILIMSEGLLKITRQLLKEIEADTSKQKNIPFSWMGGINFVQNPPQKTQSHIS